MGREEVRFAGYLGVQQVDSQETECLVRCVDRQYAARVVVGVHRQNCRPVN